MNTKRQQRLARAIENLSGRDLLVFLQAIGSCFTDDTKMRLQMRILQWSEDTLSSESDES